MNHFVRISPTQGVNLAHVIAWQDRPETDAVMLWFVGGSGREYTGADRQQVLRLLDGALTREHLGESLAWWREKQTGRKP